MQSDVIIIGAGLAGLVAANELIARGKPVAILDQEGRQNLGGQAFWSLGGLLLINSGGCASAIASHSQQTTGWGPPNLTDPKTTGRANGPKPIWISQRARCGLGYIN
ncbi:MAG: glycine/D-amino acid oxidase-like deaminating enzyme [Yoonia sp.]|jgi:glycine/D-amino acid oxidase-like deaminating enzyme